MGYEARNRIADLRNGHGPAQQIVQWNPVVAAFGIVDAILPGQLSMPIQVAAGSAPIMAAMPDWSSIYAQAVEEVAKRGDTSADATHQLSVLAAVADFQRNAVTLAQLAGELRKPKAPDEPLPEAPGWAPKLVDDDAPNGGGCAE